MPAIVAFTIFACIYTLGELIAYKTKAALSTVLVVAFILLIGFWVGLPTDIFEASTLVPVGTMLIGILITGMGNMLDFAELKRQWRTVVVALCTCVAATALCFFIGQFIIGRDLAMAGATIFSGTSTASLIMGQALGEQGRDVLALFVILMLVCQNFVGIPIASFSLKRSGRKFLQDKELYALYETPVEKVKEAQTKRRLLELPKVFDRPSMSMAKLGLVTVLSYYIAQWTNGTLNYIVVALVLGTIFTELGFLDKDSLEKTKSIGFLYMSCIIILFTNLTNAQPAQLLSLIIPLIITLGIGVIGAIISGVIFGKIFKVEINLAISMCLTCTFGFPTTLFMSNEVSTALGETPEQIEILGNYLRPKMVTAGFVTGILSIFIAGFVSGII
jgi:hypothetical protein